MNLKSFAFENETYFENQIILEFHPPTEFARDTVLYIVVRSLSSEQNVIKPIKLISGTIIKCPHGLRHTSNVQILNVSCLLAATGRSLTTSPINAGLVDMRVSSGGATTVRSPVIG